MLKRRHFIATSAFAAAGLAAPNLIGLGRAQAQAIDVLKLFVPAAPGGGWDQTARSLESVLRATGAIGAAQVTNVAGAGGVEIGRAHV